MRQALRILCKDFRHLWPRVAVFVFLATVYAYIEAIFPRDFKLMFAEGICGTLLLLAAWFIVVSVIHEDRVTGDRQFWLARPYSWKSLLLAKTLFMLLFLSLPVLLAQIAALAGAGLSPAHYLPDLLVRQFRFAVIILLPCAALAAVTANLAEFAMANLMVLAGLYALLIGLSMLLSMDALAVGSAAPAIATIHWAITALIACWVCVLQYSSRATSRARWLVAGGIVLPFVFPAILPWGAAFALLARQSPAVNPAILRLSIDPGRDRHTWPGGETHWMHDDSLGVTVPIRVAGIPAGMQAYSNRSNVTVEAPGGATWRSGWNSLNRVYSVTRADVNKGQILPGDGGPYWLYANIDRSFFDRFSTTPIHLRATVAFTMLGKATTTRLSVSNRRQPLPDDGFCYLQSQNGLVQNLCFAPLRTVSGNALRIQSLSSGAVSDDEQVEGLSSPTSGANIFSIWERLSPGLAYRPPPAPFEISFETRQTVAHFERVLDLQGIRLEGFRK
jgi:hypothetical protein